MVRAFSLLPLKTWSFSFFLFVPGCPFDIPCALLIRFSLKTFFPPFFSGNSFGTGRESLNLAFLPFAQNDCPGWQKCSFFPPPFPDYHNALVETGFFPLDSPPKTPPSFPRRRHNGVFYPSFPPLCLACGGNYFTKWTPLSLRFCPFFYSILNDWALLLYVSSPGSLPRLTLASPPLPPHTRRTPVLPFFFLLRVHCSLVVGSVSPFSPADGGLDPGSLFTGCCRLWKVSFAKDFSFGLSKAGGFSFSR